MRPLLTFAILCALPVLAAEAADADESPPFASAAGDSSSDYPHPVFTTFDDCFGRSPVNDATPPSAQYVFSGVIRGHQNTPISGWPAFDVWIEVKAPCANPVIVHPIGPSGAEGEVFWDASTLTLAGGACEGPSIVGLFVAELEFSTLDEVRSPDQDGDGLVALGDLVVFQAAYVDQSPEYQGDLDCDGAIALADLLRFQQHFAVAGP